VDMPLVSPATLRRLVDAAHDRDGAVLVDDEDRLQYLCAAYSVSALERARDASAEGSAHGLAMRDLVSGLDLVRVVAIGDETRDLDTWDDLAELRGRFED